MTHATNYPLSWPEQFPRVPPQQRQRSQFKSTLNAALNNVEHSLKLFARDSGKKLTDITISSNVSLGNNKPVDVGVAVWFTWDGLSVCIPVDKYQKVEWNLQAIHYIIEARRVELKHGTLNLIRATMTGFLALPPPPKNDWRKLLGVASGRDVPDPSEETLKTLYRAAISKAHPDRNNGDNSLATEINVAYERAKKDLGYN